MYQLPGSLEQHRVSSVDINSVCMGEVRYAPLKSFWFIGMSGFSIVGGIYYFSYAALCIFLLSTGFVLLFGHSLGSHRKLIHNSFQCPRWLEYTLVYLGVLVGLAGPIGLLRQHELRDYAQRLPLCHDYLRHGRSIWQDGWWQLNCDLILKNPPTITVETAITNNPFYQFLEKTWMLQQLPWAILLYWWGGAGFVCWGVCARVMAGIFGHWLIGFFAHDHANHHITITMLIQILQN